MSDEKRSAPEPLNNRAPDPETRTPTRAEKFRERRVGDCGCGKKKAPVPPEPEPAP
jgi:hypothetical protein